MRPVDYSKLKSRRCSKCKRRKQIKEFSSYVDANAPLGWRYYSRCKACNRKDCKAYSASNKPKRNARLRDWRKKNPEKARANDRRKHIRRYGITLDDLEAMRVRQANLCLLCLQAKSLHIDHCHQTGRVRGLLCPSCNNVVGKVETYRMLERLTRYLAN